MKIISGGQTGVDRAALDAALKHGIECGGWCPPGRLDELGRIPDRYPLKEFVEDNKGSGCADLSSVFAARTLANVKDSDGTVVIYFGELRGGTKFTVQYCVEQKRPHKLIDAAKISPEEAAELIAEFARRKEITTLNVAGPRASEWRDGYDYTLRALEAFLSKL